jgi:drug/metabolite transporter (DMT)-like permease
LTGELYAIAAAFLWALSSMLVKSQTYKLDIVSLAAWRTVPGVIVYLGLILLSGRLNDLLHFPSRSLGFLIGSTVLGLIVGDLLYFRSMKLIGLARAMPLSAVYPFFTLVLALLFLGERLHWAVLAGAILITGGAYMLAFPQGTRRIKRPDMGDAGTQGVALALIAAACWSVSTVALRIGLEGVNVTVANTIRVSMLAVILFGILLGRGEIGRFRQYGLRSLGITFLAGVVGTVLSTFAFLSAIQQAGAAKTSILTSTSPLFAMPLSLLVGERLTSRTLLGTILTVAGIWLIV